MSRWTSPQEWGVAEGVAGLTQQVDDALGRLGAEAAHQRLEVRAVEQLHDVVEPG